jgi:Flp pilus assembly protein protease CpaA
MAEALTLWLAGALLGAVLIAAGAALRAKPAPVRVRTRRTSGVSVRRGPRA